MREENFRRLDCDDDIVMLEKDTFTVARLKELLTNNLKELVEKTGQQIDRDGIKCSLIMAGTNHLASISYLFYRFCRLAITDKSISFDLSDIRLVIPPTGIDCQLLDLESRKWIVGKIRVVSDLKIKGLHSADINLELEFSPDLTNLTEESTNEERLDDLRAKFNQLNEM
ncbi:KGK domain-containing protein [Capilliphycus salinus ALCB114379]|uniref:KGK domain-containing protein n=1 Tax=Capilliphycus salinus TaxID=2768948 RepID=UPI0039A481A4